MKTLIAICGFALLLCIPGCAGMSPEDNQRLSTEINNTVSVGMPLTTAKEHLAKAGFSCDERSYAPSISCTRMRDNILYSCIQRANLIVDAERKLVVAVKPEGNSCIGGFG
jgi:hypothetical protein